MSDGMKELYNQRLARYQAAIACEPVDRVPFASGSNYFAETYTGNTKQQTIYEPEKWLDSELKFAKAYPTVDVLRNNRIYAPLYDALGVFGNLNFARNGVEKFHVRECGNKVVANV